MNYDYECGGSEERIRDRADFTGQKGLSVNMDDGSSGVLFDEDVQLFTKVSLYGAADFSSLPHWQFFISPLTGSSTVVDYSKCFF